MSVDSIIEGVIGREGAYTNNPNDPGGATIWGITEREARANGYVGAMQSMPRDTAKMIYLKKYVRNPGFADVLAISEPIAEELIDTGVNMGPPIAILFLQRILNAFNNNGRDYPDIGVDGVLGHKQTLPALQAFLTKRGADGVTVMLRALNALQGERYIELAEKNAKLEAFTFGWFRTRISEA